jgi:hypothetical protein
MPLPRHFNSGSGAGGRRPLRARTLWAVALMALPAALGLAAAQTAAAAQSQSYTSLGDSYTAGPLIPNQLTNPIGCLRSDHNYPHLAAAVRGLSLADASCSGATTADMTAPQSVPFGTNPPQLDSVTSTTSVVTLGIGGNDINFVGIIENCVALTPFGPTKVGWNCKDFYDANGVDQIANAINATAPKVAAVLQAIHAKAAAGAKVLVVGYPAILPPSGSGCWPHMPLTFNDVPYLRAKEIQLNSMLASTAAANGAIYVNTYQPSIGHSACTDESTRWVEPLVPGSPAAPVHPNANGEAAMAHIVLTKM